MTESRVTRSARAAHLASLTPEDRPREKLLQSGSAALGDNELVAVVLGCGVRHCDVLGVAAALLASAGDVRTLSRVTAQVLMRTPGVGPSRAARLLAAVELGRRALAAPKTARPRLATPREVGAYLLPRHAGHREERFGVLLLDTKHRPIVTLVISLGILDASLVHPREVFRAATEHSAAAVVLFHNHPSGDPTPSADDIALTRRLVQAGDLMGIAVVDHIVLGDGCWHSVRDAVPGVFAR